MLLVIKEIHIKLLCQLVNLVCVQLIFVLESSLLVADCLDIFQILQYNKFKLVKKQKKIVSLDFTKIKSENVRNFLVQNSKFFVVL